jgi:hypothetical protein
METAFAENPAPGWLNQRFISGASSLLTRVTLLSAELGIRAATHSGLAPVTFPSHYS